MQKTSDSITYKRAQSVYLRSKFDYCPKEISKIAGLSSDRVRHIHSYYKKYGEEFIYCGKRGGKNNINLTPDEERKFLKRYEDISLDGNMITVTSIHLDLENFLSKSIHKSGIYKMLKRNGWRKYSQDHKIQIMIRKQLILLKKLLHVSQKGQYSS